MTRSVFNHRRQPSKTLLFFDDFNRADNNTTLGASVGTGLLAPQSWTNQLATWGITSNQAKNQVSSGSSRATVDLGVADVDISITCRTTNNNNNGILLRYANSTTWFGLLFSGSNLELFKRSTVTNLITVGSLSPVSGDVMRVTAQGDNYAIYFNGVLKGTATDSSNSAATKHGLVDGSGSSQAIYDDFTVYSM